MAALAMLRGVAAARPVASLAAAGALSRLPYSARRTPSSAWHPWPVSSAACRPYSGWSFDDSDMTDTDHAEETKKIVTKIVLTGGPCGGKSTAMAALGRSMRERGFNVFNVPEVATILINGGTSFLGIGPDSTLELQSSLAKSQIALEDAFVSVATATSRENKKASIVLCDRGLLDGSAYMTPSEWDIMLDQEGWKTVDLRDKRYDAVFHLVTAADGAEKYYSLSNNAARSESLDEARVLDKRLQQVWLGHHNCFVFDNSTGFDAKIQRCVDAIHSVLGLPQSDKRERKFLIDLTKSAPEHEWNMHMENMELEIDFLRVKGASKNIARLTKRSQQRASSYIYSVKVIPPEPTEKPYITERGVSAREYMVLKRHKDPNRKTVVKEQRCFHYLNNFCTLNYFREPVEDLVVLEVRSHSSKKEDDDLIPPFLHVSKEVTGNSAFDSFTISKKKRS